MLYNFGIGGESYEMVDGKPVLTDLITKNSEYSLDQMLRVYGLTNWPGIQKIEMSEQIKQAGRFEMTLRLGPNITARMFAIVEAV